MNMNDLKREVMMQSKEMSRTATRRLSQFEIEAKVDDNSHASKTLQE
jgi:hypothetical protein